MRGKTIPNVLYKQQSTLMSAPSCMRLLDSLDSILRRRSCFTASSLAWYRLRYSATSSAVAFICAAIVTARSWCCSQHTVLQTSDFMAIIYGLRLPLRLGIGLQHLSDTILRVETLWGNRSGGLCLCCCLSCSEKKDATVSLGDSRLYPA